MSGPEIRVRSRGTRRSAGRRLAALLLAAAATAAAVEVLAVLVYPLIAEQPYSRTRIRDRIAERVRTAPTPDGDAAQAMRPFMPRHILHPYAGFSYDPRRDPEVNEFGFTGESPIAKRSPDRLNVALFGGSVAHELYRQAGERLRARLAASPAYRGREVHLICLAVDGFKQPQALLALTFSVYLGAEYDLVVNLDGFNEAVLPFTDNLPHRISPDYPRMWNFYADKGTSVRRAVQIAEIASVRERQRALGRLFSRPALRASNFALILWESLDRRCEREAQRLERALAERGNPDAGYGPPPDPEKPAQLHARDAASRWARASLQMRDLAEASGARYFHFLQPNQYVPGSKVLSAWEQRFADIDAAESRQYGYHPSALGYKSAAQLGYPLLIQEGAALRERGVRFADLTRIFADVRETIYRDACCHYNEAGYAMLADRIAQEILRDDEGGG